MCGIVGIFFRVLVGRQSWLAMSLAVAFGVPIMELASLSYPPGILSFSAKLTLLVIKPMYCISCVQYGLFASSHLVIPYCRVGYHYTDYNSCP